jgi:hypothetical protein
MGNSPSVMKMREGFWLGLHPYFNANSFILLAVFVSVCKGTTFLVNALIFSAKSFKSRLNLGFLFAKFLYKYKRIQISWNFAPGKLRV